MKRKEIQTTGCRPQRKKAALFKAMCAAAMALVLIYPALPVFATTSSTVGMDVINAKFTSLKDLVGGIVSSIGQIITLWGISEWGIAFQSSEGTMQAQAFKRIGGGLVMAMATQILTLIL